LPCGISLPLGKETAFDRLFKTNFRAIHKTTIALRKRIFLAAFFLSRPSSWGEKKIFVAFCRKN
jgi:hypothetical protein